MSTRAALCVTGNKVAVLPEISLQCCVRAASRLASQLVAWFIKHKRDLPWRRTRDPYAIWVSEVMLQQTVVKTVIPYWERWMRELPTIQSLAGARPERVLKLWEGLGYYSRARNLQKAAQQIVSIHSGVFPNDIANILELPGVGRYTSGAIASIAFGLPAPIVDGNVARVLTRYCGIRGDPKTRETSNELWDLATRLVEAAHETDACGDLNQALMELGATICLPKNPECARCPVRVRCFAWKNKLTGTLPEIAPRPKTEARLFRAALVRRNRKILLRQRPAGVVNAGFWELPNIEANGETARETFSRLFKNADPAPKLLCNVKHSITRYRMTLELFEAKGETIEECNWLDINQLNALPLVSSHRKALERAGVLERAEKS